MEKYDDIRKGLSFNKTPDVYGAFPTDPYSHTPKVQGAKQPGMTGMVKEEILTRQMELGFSVENGSIVFDFLLFDKQEFLLPPLTYTYWNVNGQKEQIECPAKAVLYSVCQVPVMLQDSKEPSIELYFSDGKVQKISGHNLDPVNSQHIFQRDGVIHHLVVSIP
jgi:hypothetical protein